MMGKYIVKKYVVPLIWAQRVKTLQKSSRYTTAVHEDVGERIGPFLTGYETGRAVGLKSLSAVTTVLRNVRTTINGYRFYHEDTKTLTFNIPDVRYAKEQKLLLYVTKHTLKTIEQNFDVCGFNIIEIGKFNGNRTKIKVKCCNIECDDTIEKPYSHFISHEQPPYCKSCSAIISSAVLPTEFGKKSLLDVRPDLVPFYHVENNDGIEMNDISHGSRKKIFLRCDQCNKKQTNNEILAAKYYSSLKNDGTFLSNFTCSHCNSIGMKFPHLIEEWHEKNEKTPFDYSFGSSEKVWWKCEKGHEWKTTGNLRTSKNNTGCPDCSESKGEKAIAQYLDELNVEYETQFPAKIGKSTRKFDLYIPMFNLFIEVHGVQHYEYVKHFKTLLKTRQQIDLQKQQHAEQNGYYMAVDYREHNPELTLERFQKQFNNFILTNELKAHIL